jgi:hypothetical protein
MIRLALKALGERFHLTLTALANRFHLPAIVLALSLITALSSHAQWHANWIVPPGGDGREYGVYYFRKNIDLAAKPGSFVVHVSADNRYKAFPFTSMTLSIVRVPSSLLKSFSVSNT